VNGMTALRAYDSACGCDDGALAPMMGLARR
jgi:hypothetical protein